MQLDPSAYAVPLVGAVVALTLATIMNPRCATLETSISATGDSSTLVFASMTSAEVEIGLMFEVHWHANKVEPITTVAVVPLKLVTLRHCSSDQRPQQVTARHWCTSPCKCQRHAS